MKKFSFIPLLLCASTLALAGCNLLGGSSSGKKSSKKKSSSTETSQVSSSSQAGGSSATSSSQQGGSGSTSTSSTPQTQTISFASIVSAFASEGVTGVVIPDYVGGTSYTLEEGVYYIKGSSNAEMQTFASSMKSAGWVLGTDEYGDYSGSFGNTRAQVYIGDYTAESQAAIIVQFQLGVEPTAAFPTAAVNEFLTTYSLGFTLSESVVAQLTDPSGSGYATTTGVDTSGTYHYICVQVSGDVASAWKAALDSTVTSAGYEWNDTYGCYVNDDEHEVQIGYASNVTKLVFFE